MKLFKCDNCGQPVYFEDTTCTKCLNRLGFDSQSLRMLSFRQDQAPIFTAVGDQGDYRNCSNNQFDVCNWVIPADSDDEFCPACSLNKVVPNVSNPDHLKRWKVIESAKHRLVYAILKWKLPFQNKIQDKKNGLAFDFKSDEGMPDGQKVLTGHAEGLITINIAEADDVERAMAKKNMDEVYRTVLGHFRHEVGHYYWEQLIVNNPTYLEGFRDLYGDDRIDYQESMDTYYKEGAPDNWKENYISAYATMHPWESWAETWAHYMHIVGTLETAYSYGITINPRIDPYNQTIAASIDFDPYNIEEFDPIFNSWLPVSFMMNSLNRSMGAQDLYPFYINPTVKKKLDFIHRVIHGQDLA